MILKIKDINWKVEVCENPDTKDDDTNGLTTDVEYTIRISNKLKGISLKKIIIHEVTHAYLFTYGFGQIDSFKDENICDFIETYGEDIIKDSIKIEKAISK